MKSLPRRPRNGAQWLRVGAFALLAALSLFGFQTPSLAAEPGVQVLAGDEFVTQFRASVGSKNSYTFVPLTDSTIATSFQALLESLLMGDLSAAQDALTTLDRLGVRYKLVQLEGVNNGPVYGFMERVAPGTPDYRGWGAVLVRPAATGARVYQAPHVKADLYTEYLAFDAFANDPEAPVVLFAGAHRYANGRENPVADVAHNTTNLFHVLTMYLAQRGSALGRPYWFIQFHGSRDRDSEPDIVGSNGADNPQFAPAAPLVELDAAVDGAGYVGMGVCGWREGARDDQDGEYRLCGTSNVQGDALESLGLRERFVHLEIERHVRNDYRAGEGEGYNGILSLMAGLQTALD